MLRQGGTEEGEVDEGGGRDPGEVHQGARGRVMEIAAQECWYGGTSSEEKGILWRAAPVAAVTS